MKTSLTILNCLIVIVFAPIANSIVIVPKPPEIKVESYVLYNPNTGTIIASEEETNQIKPASITKLMTAYTVFHAINEEQIAMDDPVRVSDYAMSVGGSTMFLNQYMDVTVEDLIQGMIIISGNDASVALAEHIAGNEETFAIYMNMYAEALGMKNTNYTNSSGLEEEEHFSSALDIAMLAGRIIDEFPQHFHYYSEKTYQFDQAKDLKTGKPIVQYNRNKLLRRDSSVDGMKTGYTKSAGYCLVATAQRDGTRLIAVVTGAKSSDERNNAATALLNYGFRFFEERMIIEAGKDYGEAQVWKGDSDFVHMVAKNEMELTIAKGMYDEIESSVEVFEPVIAPTPLDQPIGKLTLKLEGKVIAETNLFPGKNIEEDNLWGWLYDSALLLFE
ncbi:MAG: D-alanyl-D-alanine carboxypeptidase family protein [Gammaproteobacteria bacterium]|jgi:D-alanyl-D-alanine carboxypeptidase (penicillin-binding protein 5/6)|nr:serine-type D-Ala-D-Ala carboxypeptidase [Gammaproteobacteria bacterium]MBQ08640.1 serine-type D-Ala-D-Ala carboxypeptidase [Gammaproteobacteria bacterium]MDP6147050.1 D-alanyl-D-alanine carboxypeptidase family protein [Gammaproteobacteria bacterium]HJL79596.1 D-alanyl-D-alanine carboxypeptidase family protein [Gammaproteobacteria bacterium]HJN00444.1 D-alanyl-D-alanine carboxypeptidase family protein [Gammaproteobacteria bacterium]|tara:strand:- start:1340 stop:2506 length:1167 start_codon:yes stop_codon:yes gene_type:complete